MPELPDRLYINVCNPGSDPSQHNLATTGINSNNNIGEGDDQGRPLPLQHKIEFTPVKPVAQNVMCVTAEVTDVHAVAQQRNLQVTTTADGKIIASKDCNRDGAWSAAADASCAFTITPDNYRIVDNPIAESRRATGNYTANRARSVLDNMSPELRTIFANQRLDPTKYKDVAFFTFTKKWKPEPYPLPMYVPPQRPNAPPRQPPRQAPEPIIIPGPPAITKPQWDAKYFDRFMAWKDRVGLPPFTNVSLHAHVRIDPPGENPKGIGDYAQEVECEACYIGDSFRQGKDYHHDGSGPEEINTRAYVDPKDMFAYLSQFEFTQHGGRRCGCGSHLHVLPPAGNRFVYWRTFRALTGFFAPFFAGSDVQAGDDFAFRQSTTQWAEAPPRFTPREIENWSGGNGKHHWVLPHAENKPITFEMRLNEGIAPAAVTGARLMARIGDAFSDMGLIPNWKQELFDLGRRTIAHHTIPANETRPAMPPVTKVADVKSIMVPPNDNKTAEVLTKVLGMEILPGREYSLPQILTAAEAAFAPVLKDYERAWIQNVKTGNTWSKQITQARTARAGIQKTQNALSQFANPTSNLPARDRINVTRTRSAPIVQENEPDEPEPEDYDDDDDNY